MRKGSEIPGYLRESTPSRGNNHCKDSDVGAYLAYLSKSKEASVAEFREKEGNNSR